MNYFSHEEWITSHDFRLGRFEVILHKRKFWGDFLRSWGLRSSGGWLYTPFGSLYINW